ncbi:MAG: FAD-binding oxidoreductase, partial [Proteiniphilum sp.]|nr:FAD-binding oxidoreductase [Proteiniphilum sp.]
ILSEEGASIDAFKAAHELIRRNHEKGMQVYDHTSIKKFSYENDGVKIVTEEGFTVLCKKIVFCTGFETLKMFRKKYADIITTFACVSEEDFNLYPVLKDVLLWNTADPYIYMRTTDDKRLLVGGEDIPYKYNGISEKIKSKKIVNLKRKIKDLFPTLRFTEDYQWAGAFGVTKDGLPYIGEHPDFPNAIFVLGLGGNGITFSVQGMDLVLKILAGETDPLLHYYRFDR